MAKKYQRQWEYSLEQTKQYVEHPKAPADGSAPAWKVSSRGNPDHFALSMDLKRCSNPRSRNTTPTD